MFTCLLLIVVVAGVLVMQSRAAETTDAQYELLSGVVGTVEDSMPSNAEAALARQRLGDHGFIGYIPCTLETELTTFLARAMGDVAREYGVEYQVFDAHMDSYLQSTLIEDARRQGAQALIVCQIDARALAPTLQSAAAGGVILAFNAPPQVDEGAVIAVDSSEMGRKLGVEAGEYIHAMMGGRARVLVINLPSSPSSSMMAAAMEAALLQVAPEAEIIARHAGITREDGRAIALHMHENDIAYDVVLAVTDAAAFGVISLLEEQGVAEEAVAIFSVNGESLARQYVRQGHYLRATIVFDRETLARATMEAVIKMLGGGTLPRTILVTESEVITADSQSTMP
ncbi:MAG: sugar ABC transporter substrate-binding protein [Chloroflexi bacterium]|uniref:sugar ABC transporter substrate-binding protein n=1 Tax=Candidatus Flexifilum breve TaxID=3140694 RepID=UPI003136AE40|nr:sugar ABC transporter substrate-binding protein [Chloroflexota bacterium]